MMSRPATNLMLQALDDGILDIAVVCKNLLQWLSETDVQHFMETEYDEVIEYYLGSDEDEEESEEDTESESNEIMPERDDDLGYYPEDNDSSPEES